MKLDATGIVVVLAAGVVASCGGSGASTSGSPDGGSLDGTTSRDGSGSTTDGSGSSSGAESGSSMKVDSSSTSDAESGGPTPQGTLIGAFTGVNGLIADTVDLLAPIGTVREYHNWGWICDNYAAGPAYPAMLYEFLNFNGWDWDTWWCSPTSSQTASRPR